MVKQDEFNPGLQFALGEVLLWMKRFPEAAHHFDVAQHLDKNFWQATWRQADAQFCAWETANDLSARQAASELYSEMLKPQSDGPLAAQSLAAVLLFEIEQNRESKARAWASKQLAALMSPVGTWITEDKRTFKVTLENGRWYFSPTAYQARGSRFSFDAPVISLRDSEAPTMVGSGLADDNECVRNVSVKAQMDRYATKMTVEGIPTGQISPSFSSVDRAKSMSELRSLVRSCQKFTFVGTVMYRIKLTRVEDLLKIQ